MHSFKSLRCAVICGCGNRMRCVDREHIPKNNHQKVLRLLKNIPEEDINTKSKDWLVKSYFASSDRKNSLIKLKPLTLASTKIKSSTENNKNPLVSTSSTKILDGIEIF